MQDGKASAEKRDEEDILLAWDFRLRNKGCCGKTDLQPALLGSKEPSL